MINGQDLKEIIDKNKDSGLFIDEQLACPSLCWELYAQRTTSTNSKEVDESSGYTDLLLRGIIHDETPTIEVEVSHSYDNIHLATSASQKAKEFWNAQKQIQLATSTIGSTISSGLKTVGEELTGKADNVISGAVDAVSGAADKMKSKIDSFIDKGLSKLGGGLSVAGILDASRGSLMMGTSSIKYYDGTNISIKIPSIQFRYYHDTYNGVSVKDLVMSLNERLIGDFSGTNELGLTNTSGASLGVMKAPNGYVASGMDVIGLSNDNPKKGTFMIRYAGKEIPNLICKHYSVKLSTTKVKSNNPTSVSDMINSIRKLDQGVLTPNSIKEGLASDDNYLYADIEIEFEPIAIFTKENINSMINA